jgi:biotin carboxylase
LRDASDHLLEKIVLAMTSYDKKMLIAGGGYADIPLILSAKKLGYYVYTTGNRPEELGHNYSNEYIKADFSNLDEMLDLANQIKIDAVCPCCNDFSALSSSYIAENMNLPGHDKFLTTKLIHHKDSYRKFASENGIATPRAKSYTDSAEAILDIDSFLFPLIVKPVDLTGGKGVTTIRSKDETKKAINKAFDISRAKKIVIEEFLQGTRHGFSAFLRDSKVVFYFTDNEYYYLNQYLVSGASAPGDVPQNVVKILIADSEKIASILKLKTGIFHIQFIINNGEPVIIEICRRPPGDLYVKLVEISTGIDYPGYIVRAFTGDNCDDMTHADPKGFYTRHCVMCDRTGIIKDIFIDPAIKDNIIEKFMWWNPDDSVTDIYTAKFGIVFLKFNSMDEMLKKSSELQELIKVKIE